MLIWFAKGPQWRDVTAAMIVDAQILSGINARKVVEQTTGAGLNATEGYRGDVEVVSVPCVILCAMNAGAPVMS